MMFDNAYDNSEVLLFHISILMINLTWMSLRYINILKSDLHDVWTSGRMQINASLDKLKLRI